MADRKGFATETMADAAGNIAYREASLAGEFPRGWAIEPAPGGGYFVRLGCKRFSRDIWPLPCAWD